MKIESYVILKNTLVLKFNKKFKHIKLVKLELIDGNGNVVETDNLEMKFSKEKDEIILFIRENIVFVMIYINMIDNEECNNAFYINKDSGNESSNEGSMDVLGNGISMLIKSKAGDFFKNDIDESVNKKVCLIKSENIFAEINKKVLIK